MKIDNVWNLTREQFIIQLEDVEVDELKDIEKELSDKFPNSIFFFNVLKGGNN